MKEQIAREVEHHEQQVLFKFYICILKKKNFILQTYTTLKF